MIFFETVKKFWGQALLSSSVFGLLVCHGAADPAWLEMNPLRREDLRELPYNAILYLECHHHDGSTITSTAFYMGNGMALASAHALGRNPYDVICYLRRYGQNYHCDLRVSQYVIPLTYIEARRDWDNVNIGQKTRGDYALLQLVNQTPGDIGLIPFHLEENDLMAQGLRVAGYPEYYGGVPHESNLLIPHDLLDECLVFQGFRFRPGTSGSPVRLNENGNMAVAIVTSNRRDYVYSYACPLTNDKIQRIQDWIEILNRNIDPADKIIPIRDFGGHLRPLNIIYAHGFPRAFALFMNQYGNPPPYLS